MRGQEPGSEPDRREADGSSAPATPPPSFGQIGGRDMPSAFTPADEAAHDSAEGMTRDAAEGAVHGPTDGVPRGPADGAVRGSAGSAARGSADGGMRDPADHAARGSAESAGRGSGDGGVRGSGDDAASASAHDAAHASPGRSESAPSGGAAGAGEHPAIPVFQGPPPNLPDPDEPPGTQPWEVAGDDAAEYDWFADDDVEPTRPGELRPYIPLSDPTRPARPPLPPAGPVVPGAPPWEPPPAFTAAAAGMPAWPAPLSDPHAVPPWPAATGELVAEPDNDEPSTPFDPNATNPEGFTRPAHYFDPEAARREASQRAQAGAGAPRQQEDAQHPAEADDAPPSKQASAPPARQRSVPLSAPVAPPQEETRPPDQEGAAEPPHGTKQPAHYFDPKAARRDHPPVSLSDPANVPVHPAEPGDVPVWPPTPPTETKLPDLPFPRDTWGQKPLPPGGGPAFPSGAFKQPPFQTPPPPPAPPGKSRRALFVTLGALALAGVATGGFFAYQAVSPPAPTTTAARPSASGQASSEQPPSAEPSDAQPSDAPGGTSILNSEQTDPQKLSLSEAFPKKKVSAAGTTFTRIKADMETSCDKAAVGAFADALRERKCGRVLRATYVDSKRRYAVTTGIAVLPDKDAAAAADKAKNLSRNIWFRPLPGAAGSGGERVHIAGGYASGLVWGRYMVFSYATYADGHTPDPKDKTLPKVSGALRDQTSLVLERRVTKG
ncbi:hypothetical protein [Nonomuraea sp. NPDC049695]|uniref:hypothetical protein n=1 Tax=Nonomuraea sp. NPDC049695 TaxID=3154734 RepID=UPI0034130FBD